MKNSFFSTYEFKFFLIAVSTGVLISIFPLTYNIIQFQKRKNELSKNIRACLKKPHFQKKIGSQLPDNNTPTITAIDPATTKPIITQPLPGSPSSDSTIPVVTHIICNSKFLADSLINYPQFKLQGVQLEIAKNEVRYLATKSKIFYLPMIIVPIFFLLGTLPLLWVFFLNRICDISDAIRGNKK